MKQLRYFLILFIICFCANAQDSGWLYKDAKTKKEKDTISPSILVGLSPLSLIDLFDGASLRANAEVLLHKNISFALEGGYYLNYLPVSRKKPEGYLFKPAIKYYFNEIKKLEGSYIALEYQYKNIDYELRDSIKVNGVGFVKQYPMHRTVNCISLKYGALKDLGGRWFLEYYYGVGVRFIKSDAFNLSQEEQDGIIRSAAAAEDDGDTTSSYLRKTGNIVSLNVTAGIKINYRIK